ncbi:MAG: diguanylate cyclase [bacterium]|nr:diguanylate cyclase [bacterium]
MDLTRRLSVMIIPAELKQREDVAASFTRWGIDPVFLEDQGQAIGGVFESPPAAIVLDRVSDSENGYEFARMIKLDHALAHIPIIMRINETDLAEILDWESMPIDDFVTDWSDPEILALRIRLCCESGTRELDANPLTRLGGNNAIRRCIAEKLEAKKNFAVGYIDLDNFKAFNDTYGFARGDEVIRLVARLLATSLQVTNLKEESMVGHVGGDDFVFIIPCHGIKSVCEEMIKRFDLMVRKLYDEDDVQQGGLRAINRTGDMEFFPFVSLSIAVAMNYEGSIEHPGQFSSILGDMKKKAKARRVSNYIIDQRHTGGYQVESETDKRNQIA